jgi:hypothetical protein
MAQKTGEIERFIWHSRVNMETEGVCGSCHKLFDLKTRAPILAWARAYFLTAGDKTCSSCDGVNSAQETSR